MRDIEAEPSGASGIGAAKPDADVHVGDRLAEQPAGRAAGVDKRGSAGAERSHAPPALNLGRFVYEEPTEPLGSKTFAFGENRMRAQQ